MLHEMTLFPKPYASIASGQKTIELRLYDEKRQSIQIGDHIRFTNTLDLRKQHSAKWFSCISLKTLQNYTRAYRY